MLWRLRSSVWGSVVRVTWHPVDREVAEKDKGSARAEVLIILGVEGLAPCRHPPTLSNRRIKGRFLLRGLFRLTIANLVEWKTTEFNLEEGLLF
jgi:hypothetical protein